MEPIYAATRDERELAMLWHGGQASMLCAVSSTGALSRGTIRNGRSDAEWSLGLVGQLRRELADILRANNADEWDRRTATAWLAKLAPIEGALDDAVDAECND